MLCGSDGTPIVARLDSPTLPFTFTPSPPDPLNPIQLTMTSVAARVRLAAVVLALLNAESAAAQKLTLDFVPYAGVFQPVTDLATSNAGNPSVGNADLVVSQGEGFLFGTRLRAWWSRAFGWEGNFAYALSDGEIRVDDPAGSGDDICEDRNLKCNASVWFASSKLIFRLAPRPYTGWSLHVGGGVAVINRVGDLWEEADGTADIGGTLGIGGTFDLSETLGLRIDAEDFLYSFKVSVENNPELGTSDAVSNFQNDLVFSVGLVVRLN